MNITNKITKMNKNNTINDNKNKINFNHYNRLNILMYGNSLVAAQIVSIFFHINSQDSNRNESDDS